MKTIEVGYDPYVWAEVPLGFPRGEYASQAEWAAAIATAYTDGRVDAEQAWPRLEAIAAALPVEERLGLFALLWHHPDPDAEPLLVNVYAVPAEPYEGDSLSELAGAYDAEPIRPPVVDTLDSAAFGSVVRVVGAFREEERNRLVLRLVAVGRRDGVLIRLDGLTSDLARGALAADDLLALMESIAVREETEPAGE